MRVLFIGNHDIGHSCLAHLLQHDEFEVCGVIGIPTDPNERNYYASVQGLAEEHGIPFAAPENINAPDTLQWIREMQPDLIPVISYRQLLGPELIEIPTRGCINLHGAKLPAFRGASPINWALIENAEETGVTIHFIDEKVDHGPIIGQRGWPIDYQDTAITLFNRLTKEGAELFVEVMDAFLTDSVSTRPNETQKGSYYYRRTPKDGIIDWNKPSTHVYNFIRALVYPFPGAFTYVDDKKLTVWWGVPSPLRPSDATPGELFTFSHSGQWGIACAEGSIILHEVEVDTEGKGCADTILASSKLTPGMRGEAQ